MEEKKEFFFDSNNSEELLASSKKEFFADLHIHSRFSRACSKDLNLTNLEKWAKIKGLDLLGTGDFSHPLWLNELKENLEDRNGILYTKTGFRFILTGEISLIYTQERGRKVHLVLLAPSFEVVDKINSYLDKKGRRDYDGRPIFKISCHDFTRDMKEISKDIEIIPAHIWTPYFGVFGSESGFDTLKDAFGEEFENIHAIETGMSSDPEMNWKISELNNKTIVSFSDSHSFWPWRLGREATIFSSINSYHEIINQIRENKILGTIETDPCYGKYHYDGHAKCNFSCSPEETRKNGGNCPICGEKLTIGVEYRVEKLKDQDTEKHPNRKHFYKLLPLHELISAVLGNAMTSKKVKNEYDRLIKEFGNEINILINLPEEKLNETINEELMELIRLNRKGKIKVKPGYDGQYGVMEYNGKLIDVEKEDKDSCDNQKKLF